MKDRKSGFYWVQFHKGDWVVAQWYSPSKIWLVPGEPYEGKDDSFSAIGAEVVREPSQLPIPPKKLPLYCFCSN